MKAKEFFGKFVSRYLLLHLLAMTIVLLALLIGVWYGLSSYTRHGEGYTLPDFTGVDYKEALAQLDEQGLLIAVTDSGYVKTKPANCILSQTPGPGTHVKAGRTVYVTVNSKSSPAIAIPDLIDNSSYREAQARLTAIGFRLLEPQRIDGERDWVYGIMNGNRQLQVGDKVPVETPLTLVIGNGLYEDEEEMGMDTMLDAPESAASDDDDDFEEVTE